MSFVTAGPYNIVRHPIYTGLLVAFLGSALARVVAPLVAVAIMFVGAVRKLRLEESWMREPFSEQYPRTAGACRALTTQFCRAARAA